MGAGAVAELGLLGRGPFGEDGVVWAEAATVSMASAAAAAIGILCMGQLQYSSRLPSQQAPPLRVPPALGHSAAQEGAMMGAQGGHKPSGMAGRRSGCILWLAGGLLPSARAGRRFVGPWRLARSGSRVCAFNPLRHRSYAGDRRHEPESAFVCLPLELIDRDCNTVAADPQDATGANHEPVDLLGLRVDQRRRHIPQLAVVAIDAGALNAGNISLGQRVDRRFAGDRSLRRGLGERPRLVRRGWEPG